jgi:AcrR family transcriptional regulator
MATPPAAPKRTRLTADQRRERILEAAGKVFTESGFAGARTRRIAEEAGVTEALLYKFFPSKSEIFRAAVHEPLVRFVEELLATTQDIDARNEDREATLRQVNEMLLRFMADSAPLLAVVLLSDLTEARRFYQGELHPVLSQPVYEVVSRITGWRQRDGSMIFAAMFGVHIGLAFDALLRERALDAAKVADQLTTLFSHGVPEEVQAAPVSFGRPKRRR